MSVPSDFPGIFLVRLFPDGMDSEHRRTYAACDISDIEHAKPIATGLRPEWPLPRGPQQPGNKGLAYFAGSELRLLTANEGAA